MLCMCYKVKVTLHRPKKATLQVQISLIFSSLAGPLFIFFTCLCNSYYYYFFSVLLFRTVWASTLGVVSLVRSIKGCGSALRGLWMQPSRLSRRTLQQRTKLGSCRRRPSWVSSSILMWSPCMEWSAKMTKLVAVAFIGKKLVNIN